MSSVQRQCVGVFEVKFPQPKVFYDNSAIKTINSYRYGSVIHSSCCVKYLFSTFVINQYDKNSVI